MNNFGTLYKYELKKIVNKKFTIISLLMIYAMLIMFAYMNYMSHKYQVGEYLSDLTYSEILSRETGYDRMLSGRQIDDDLIKQAQSAYIKYHDFRDPLGDDLSEEQEQAVQDLYWNTYRPYRSICQFCTRILNMSGTEFAAWDASEEDLYSIMNDNIQDRFDIYYLTDKERDFWNDKISMMKTPFTYYYCESYKITISEEYFLCVVLTIFAGISLCGVFADEKASHCDQLILSSRNGKKTVYFAKLLAGLTFTEGAAIITLLVYAGLTFITYGTDGFNTDLELYRLSYPYPVSIGTFMLAVCLILLIIIMLISLVVMLISINTDRSIIPLGIIMARVIIGMFVQVPMSMRVLSRIWTLLPTNYLYASYIYDLRLISFFGHYFVSWQVMPWIYIAVSIVLFFIGKSLYVKCQNS